MNVPWWVFLLGALVTAGPSYLAAWNSVHNRRQLKIPSGGTIGGKMELTHDLAAINAAGRLAIAKPALEQAVDHINGDPDSPVLIERRETEGEPPNGEERRNDEQHDA